MSAITAKASRKMKKYAVLTREPRCFLGSFDFSWEQRKFSELVQIERGGSPRPIDDFITDAPNGLNWVKIGDAPTQGNYITKTAEKIRPEGLSKTREVHPGDLILSNSMSFGKPYIMGIDGCIHDGWLLIRNTYGVFDLTFLCHLLGTPQMLSQYRSLAADSTVNNLNKELVGNTYVTIPSITEQRVLGAYLEQLDNLITLHQRKCVFLFGFFQAFISMIFTASTFSWEQRKLGDVVQITMGQSPDGSTYSDEPSDYILVQGNADLQNGWVCPRIWTTQITKKADAGDLIMSVRAPAGAMGKTAYNAVIGRGVAAIKGNEFIYQLLVKMDADGFWKTLSCGSTFESLNSDNIKNAEVKIPTTAEQIKIGGYFQQLDNLITLHQRECISFTARAGRLILTANKKRNTSSWEQRKLGELGTITTGNTPSTSIPDYYSDDGIVWVTPTDVCENITFESARKLSDLGQQVGRVVPKNTILVTCIASIGKNTMLGNTGSFNQQINGLTPNENKYDPYFLLTESALWSAKMKGSAAAGTMQIVNRTEFSELKTWLPSLIEQQAIGAFFKQLDHLITLHQRKPFLMKWRTSDANRNQTNRLVL